MKKRRPTPHQQVMLAALAEELKLKLITIEEYTERAKAIMREEG